MLVRKRSGTTLVEVLVAFTLLTTMIGVLIPTVIRHGRFQQALCDERLAMDELSNQLDALSSLSPDQLVTAIEELEASDAVRDRLSDVKLAADLSTEEDYGRRITLQISWHAPGRRENPLKLTTWIYPVELVQTSEEP